MEPNPPARRDLGPKIAAILVIAVMTGVVWWRSVYLDSPTAPVAAAPTAPTQPAPKSMAPTAVPAEVAAVAAVAAFAETAIPTESPGARTSTADGMRLVAAAIAARGDSGLWRDRAKRMGEAADQVQNAADSTAAADIAHDALLQAAEWIVALPARSEDGSRDAIVPAAKAIREDQPLRNQSREVEEYFDAAARALGGASI